MSFFSYEIVKGPIGRATKLGQSTDYAVLFGAKVELLAENDKEIIELDKKITSVALIKIENSKFYKL
ncbi:hypothetical protein MKZ26_06050 [Sporosarcina sp. FSL K6-6792]|uniref:hypothetical protein n=1 Tax=Sporosarcina sp. FSL K6-6792 TaxID=2921559 RepID=UPI0030F8FD53